MPVFLADVKGDLSGVAEPGTANDRVRSRAAEVHQQWTPTGFPAEFHALGGAGHGIPLRATVTGFGPLLLSKVLRLNPTQEQSLSLIFHYADTKGLELVDLKDLRAVVAFLTSDEGKRELKGIGGLPAATAGVILRSLTALEAQGMADFFGEPESDTGEFPRRAGDGRGVVSVLELPAVQGEPRLFSAFLMWLLADLFHDLPEAGDVDRPRPVFFLDEAHLLFDDASEAFLEAIAQTVRLIRSKGVGVYFVTQNPLDIPDAVLGQLGNRVQHALRAFTPRDQKAVKAAAQTMRVNPALDIETAITELGVGEALVSLLDEKGQPGVTERALIVPPMSRLGPLEPAVRAELMAASSLARRYDQAVDRESAYEKLRVRAEAEDAGKRSPRRRAGGDAQRRRGGQGNDAGSLTSEILFGRRGPRGGRKSQGLIEVMAKSAARSMGTRVGRSLMRGLLGSLLGGRK